VNREHLLAFLWLRWRLQVNQFRKAGALNAVLFFMVVGCSIVVSVGAFIGGILVGWLALPEASPSVRLYVWAGIVVSFLFFWLIGVLMDLHRTDALSLDRFLHLPVSLTGAFLINYAASWFKLTLIVYAPMMVGLLIGQTLAHGVAMLLGFPLVLALFLAATAVTYQFQGWLASLMTNPRRRRTVVVFVTLAFILLMQAPNVVNLSVRPWEINNAAMERRGARWTELNQELLAKKITPQEFQARDKQINEDYAKEVEAEANQKGDAVRRVVWLACAVLPPGWVALGAADLPDGHVLPTLLGGTGLALIGALSLWRAYRTTLRHYTGQGGSSSTRAAASPAAPVAGDPARVRLVERVLPRVSESASAVGTAALQSFLRAPEAKMVLLAPIIMVVIFGGIALTVDESPPAWSRPLIAFGIASITLVSGIQLVGNQFGYDRAGFRVYVLSPVPRREILIGKNIAAAPLTLGIGLLMLVPVECVYPMRVDRWLAVFVQCTSSYLMFCLMANLMSIFAPLPVAAGSIQASNARLVPVLIQMLCFMLYPVLLVPILLPYGVEVLLDQLDVVRNVPISLVLSLLVLLGAVALYRSLVTWQGAVFAQREQAILDVVTSKLE
jgi:hypothetical protein